MATNRITRQSAAAAGVVQQEYLNRAAEAMMGTVGVQMEFTPAKTIVDNIRFMFERMMTNTQGIANTIAREMEEYAQDNAPWQDHPDLHGTETYPNDKARRQLEANVERNGDTFMITLRHSPDTIMVTGSRAITYGGILEANVHGETEIIVPTWERFQGRLAELLASGTMKGIRTQPVRQARTVSFRSRSG